MFAIFIWMPYRSLFILELGAARAHIAISNSLGSIALGFDGVFWGGSMTCPIWQTLVSDLSTSKDRGKIGWVSLVQYMESLVRLHHGLVDIRMTRARIFFLTEPEASNRAN